MKKNMIDFSMLITLNFVIVSFVVSVFVFKLPRLNMFLYILFFCGVMFFFNKNICKKIETMTENKIALIVFLPFLICLMVFFTYTPTIYQFVPFNPYFDYSKNNIWFQDTAYHVSLIRSIMNWGYPSNGLNGHPVAIYHVLSHFFDAFLFLITGLDPFEAYGFSFFIKFSFFFYSLFLLICSQSVSLKINLLTFFVFASICVYKHAYFMISQGMQITNFILLFSISYVYNLIKKKEQLVLKEYMFLMSIGVLCALGKVCVGFCFVCIVFASLFFKEYKNKLYYIVSALFLFFFYYYNNLFSLHYRDPSFFANVISVNKVVKTILYPQTQELSLDILFCFVWGGAYYWLKKKNVGRFFFGIFISMIALEVLIKKFFSHSVDIYAFEYSFYFIVALILLCFVLDILRQFKEDKNIKILICMSMIILGCIIPGPVYSFSNFHTQKLREQWYYVKFLFKNSIPKDGEFYTKSKLEMLKDETMKILDSNKILAKDTAYFIPQRVYYASNCRKNCEQKKENNIFFQFGTELMYAATNVHFLHGIVKYMPGFSMGKNVNPNGELVNNIDDKNECNQHDVKGIIYVNKYDDDGVFLEYHRCDVNYNVDKK